MSRARVIIGTDANGRPVSEWTKTVAGDAPYGFMEPAFEPTVTRRQATPTELAASVARDTATGYLHAKPAAASRRVGAWTPEKSAERMRLSRERGTTRSVELGTVRLCRRCGEVWPLDWEFFYFDRQGRVMGHCRACWSERRKRPAA